MKVMLMQLAFLLVGLAFVSALVYFALALYARYHPNGEPAKPGGVRDLWRSINGVLYATAAVGVVVMCIDCLMGVQDFDVGFFWLITLVGGLWIGVKISILIATLIGRRNPDSIMADHTTRSYLLYTLLAVAVSIGALIILLFWLSVK